MSKKAIMEIPIEVCNKNSLNILDQLHIDPDRVPSVVAVDVEEVAAIQRSDDESCNVLMKSGVIYWTPTAYDKIFPAWCNILTSMFEVHQYSFDGTISQN